MPPKTELQHHVEVAKWLKRKYPKMIFRTDYSAGLKLTGGQARTHYRLQSGRGYPDLWIPVPAGGQHGLYLELKTPDVVLVLKDGTLTKDKHVREQMAILVRLRHSGYGAAMVQGHSQAKQAITDYLDGANIYPTKYLYTVEPPEMRSKLEEDLPF